MNHERLQRRTMITKNQPDNIQNTKKRCDNTDNKKETQLRDATTVQDRSRKTNV